MELIEAYIDSIKSSVQVQVYVTINEMFFPDSSFDRLLKDLDENVIVHLPRIQDSRETLPERGFFAGSLPAPETQILIHRATIDKNVKSYPRPSLMVRAQQPGIIEVGQQRYGVTTHLTKENSQITISLYLPPPGENLIRDPNDLSPDVKATIWDGYTAVIKKTMEDGVTLVLVSAKTMDPAGQLINPDGGLKSLLKRKK